MSDKILQDFIIPAAHGKAFRVDKGQIMKVVAIEGSQVCDIAFFNAHDYKETYDAPNSYMYNCRLGTGSNRHMKYLFSRLPRANVMMEIVEDTVGWCWAVNGGHCNWKTNVQRGISKDARSCWGNVAEAIREFGLTEFDVPNTYPLWMKVDDQTDGDYVIHASPAKKGDHADFLAHMDLMVAVSSCPGNQIPGSVINDGENRPVQIQIIERS
jgi:uncharacterized protein YcgI (DUF1989 family)